MLIYMHHRNCLVEPKYLTLNHEPIRKIKEGFVGQRMIVLPPDIKKKVDENILIQDFRLTAIGFYPNAAYHDCQRKMGSKEFIIIYCIEGEGYIKLEKKELHLTPNHYVIVPPSKPHHYLSSSNNPWSIYWIHFTGAHADFLYQRYLEKARPKNRPIPYEQSWFDIFMKVMDILEASFGEKSLEIANMNIQYLISSLIYHSEIDPAYYEDDAISRSIEFLKDNLKKSLKVGQLAKQQSLSISRYSELFREKTGFSPIKYFNNLKIQKSCQYLYFTDMSIKEICMEIGFDDPYYFSRAFKKLMGMAPSKYRMSYKNKFLEK